MQEHMEKAQGSMEKRSEISKTGEAVTSRCQLVRLQQKESADRWLNSNPDQSKATADRSHVSCLWAKFPLMGGVTIRSAGVVAKRKGGHSLFIMGYGEVVTQRTLTPSFTGSNPVTPAKSLKTCASANVFLLFLPVLVGN